jgi:uncharacterized protein (TIGR03089 family)
MTGARPPELLARALAADPSRVLLTWFHDGTGDRVELSVATFATWVAKTANLARDELDLQPGDRVLLALPAHWQALVWFQACWTAGLIPVVGNTADTADDRAADVAASVVTTDGETSYDVGTEVVGLGLGPMGLPRPGPVPDGVTVDYDRVVPGHGDRFVAGPPADPASPALELAGRTWSGDELADEVGRTSERWALGPGDRIALAPDEDEAWSLRLLLGGLLVPLATGAAAAVVRRGTEAEPAVWERRFVTERVTAITESREFFPAGVRHLD